MILTWKGESIVYYVYPAIFKPNPKGGYTADIPDMPGCVTFGKTLEDALKTIKNALCVRLCTLEDEKTKPPRATHPAEIILQDGAFMALIDVDTKKYRSEHENKAVRRNVSLPAWLNARAEQSHINVSQVLQEALRKRLKI